jgi:hypothetical protein
VLSIKNLPTLPEQMLDDLSKFISTYYRKQLPHPLLIAQMFCLKHQEYGKKYGLSTITEAVEYVVNRNLFLVFLVSIVFMGGIIVLSNLVIDQAF